MHYYFFFFAQLVVQEVTSIKDSYKKKAKMTRKVFNYIMLQMPLHLYPFCIELRINNRGSVEFSQELMVQFVLSAIHLL